MRLPTQANTFVKSNAPTRSVYARLGNGGNRVASQNQRILNRGRLVKTYPLQDRQRKTHVAQAGLLVDAPGEWSLDQIAGMAFLGFMIAFYYSSRYIDAYVARGQREDLGLCMECGGLNDESTCQNENCPFRNP